MRAPRFSVRVPTNTTDWPAGRIIRVHAGGVRSACPARRRGRGSVGRTPSGRCVLGVSLPLGALFRARLEGRGASDRGNDRRGSPAGRPTPAGARGPECASSARSVKLPPSVPLPTEDVLLRTGDAPLATEDVSLLAEPAASGENAASTPEVAPEPVASAVAEREVRPPVEEFPAESSIAGGPSPAAPVPQIAAPPEDIAPGHDDRERARARCRPVPPGARSSDGSGASRRRGAQPVGVGPRGRGAVRRTTGGLRVPPRPSGLRHPRHPRPARSRATGSGARRTDCSSTTDGGPRDRCSSSMRPAGPACSMPGASSSTSCSRSSPGRRW